MDSRRNAHLVIVCLLVFALAGFVPTADALVEEFDSGQLNEAFWVMKAEAGASYEIADGKLTMTSPDVADGILMYWNAPIGDEDLTVEIKASVAAGTDNAAALTFIKTDTPPTANTVINGEFLAMVWCGGSSGWYVNNDNWKRADAEGPETEGIWKAEITGDKIHFSFNDAEVVVVDKVATERYLCFGPDTYTSHYSGGMTIDWIKISGPTISAVQPEGKLPVMWGKIKSEL